MEQIPGTSRTFEIYAETEYSHVRFVYFRTYPLRTCCSNGGQPFPARFPPDRPVSFPDTEPKCEPSICLELTFPKSRLLDDPAASLTEFIPYIGNKRTALSGYIDFTRMCTLNRLLRCSNPLFSSSSHGQYCCARCLLKKHLSTNRYHV